MRGGQGPGGAGEQGGVHPHGHEGRAEGQGTPRQPLVGTQNPRCFARADNPGQGAFDGLHHVRMTGLAQMSQTGAEVGGADEHAVHTVHRRDVVQVLEAGARLDLHQQAHLVVGPRQVVGQRVPARGAGQRTAHPANPLRRVAGGLHQLPRLFRRLHHRHQQRLHAEVEVLLDEVRVAHWGPHDGRDWVGRQRLGAAPGCGARRWARAPRRSAASRSPRPRRFRRCRGRPAPATGRSGAAPRPARA